MGHRPVVAMAFQMTEGVLRILDRVERLLGGLSPLPQLLVQVLDVLLLDHARVSQHVGEKVGRGEGCVDAPLEPVLDQAGQGARVIDVRVAQDDGVDLSGSKPKVRLSRSASSRLPWKSPQSSRTLWPLTVRRWREPVTLRAAPVELKVHRSH